MLSTRPRYHFKSIVCVWSLSPLLLLKQHYQGCRINSLNLPMPALTYIHTLLVKGSLGSLSWPRLALCWVCSSWHVLYSSTGVLYQQVQPCSCAVQSKLEQDGLHIGVWRDLLSRLFKDLWHRTLTAFEGPVLYQFPDAYFSFQTLLPHRINCLKKTFSCPENSLFRLLFTTSGFFFFLASC